MARNVGCLPGMCPCNYHQEAPDNKGVIGRGSERSGPAGEGGDQKRATVDSVARIRAEGTRSGMTMTVIDTTEGKRRSC